MSPDSPALNGAHGLLVDAERGRDDGLLGAIGAHLKHGADDFVRQLRPRCGLAPESREECGVSLCMSPALWRPRPSARDLSQRLPPGRRERSAAKRAPLGDHVRCVFCMGPEKKVRRINTPPVVAAVADKAIGVRRAVKYFPGHAVGHHVSARPEHVSVAIRLARTSPPPAPGNDFGRNLHLLKKAVAQRTWPWTLLFPHAPCASTWARHAVKPGVS